MITEMSAAQNEPPSGRTRRELAGAWAIITFSVALMLNAIEAWTDPDGLPWTVIRWTVTIAFALALMWWIYSSFEERQQTKRGAGPHD